MPLILLKIKNNKKIIYSYYSPKKILFIGMFALFMSHEQCKRRWSLKKKKKKEPDTDTPNANTNQMELTVICPSNNSILFF